MNNKRKYIITIEETVIKKHKVIIEADCPKTNIYRADIAIEDESSLDGVIEIIEEICEDNSGSILEIKDSILEYPSSFKCLLIEDEHYE